MTYIWNIKSLNTTLIESLSQYNNLFPASSENKFKITPALALATA